MRPKPLAVLHQFPERVNGRVEYLFPVNGRVSAQAVAVEVEHIETDRMLDVIGIDEHEAVRQALSGVLTKVRKPGDRPDKITLTVYHHDRPGVLNRTDEVM